MPPTAPESLSTRDRFFEVAAELFAERGYSGTSMADIARRVGVRKPSLYNYCSSKEELFMKLLEGSIEAWRGASDPALLGAGTCRERLRRHFQDTVDFAAKSPHAVAICRLAVSQVTGELGERARELLLRYRLAYRERLDAIFAAARDAGEVREVPPEVMTLAWLTFLDGFLTRQIFSLGDRGQAHRRHLEEIWQLFWRGLAAEGGGKLDE